MEYFLFLYTICLITLIFKKININYKKDKVYLLLVFFIMLLFLGLRSETTGLDMYNYKVFFMRVNEMSFFDIFKGTGFEIGFTLFTKLMTIISSSFHFYIFIIALISLIGVYCFIRDNSKNYFMSCYIFITYNYFIYYTCTLRQCIAISFLLLAYNQLKKENVKKFILLTLLATTFHKTALVFILLLVFKYFDYTYKNLKYYIIGCFTLLILKSPIIWMFKRIFYNQYMNISSHSGEGWITLLIIVGSLIVYYFADLIYNIYRKKDKYLIGMLILALPFQILATSQSLVSRLTLYFLYCYPILFPNVLNALHFKNKKYYTFIVYIILLLFFIIQVYNNHTYVDYILVLWG